MHFASAHGKANMVNCHDAFEGLFEIPNLKDVLFHLILWGRYPGRGRWQETTRGRTAVRLLLKERSASPRKEADLGQTYALEKVRIRFVNAEQQRPQKPRS
jgi:hypothetical protein